MPNNPQRRITRDSVFRTTAAAPADAPAATPKADDSETHQTAIWLADDETDWLDDKVKEVKRSGWRGVTRSAIVRALIRAHIEQDTSLRGATDEAELLRMMLQQRDTE